MSSIIEALLKEPDILKNKNRLKRLFLHDPELSEKQAMDMIRAYDLDVVKWLRTSHPDRETATAQLYNDFKNAGMSEEGTTEALERWSEITKAVLGKVKTPIKKEPAPAAVPEPPTDPEPSYEVSGEVSYVNPTAPEGTGIYIPCGIGKTDHGFFIRGIERETFCRHPAADVFALVYNMLIRNTKITEEDVPAILKTETGSYSVDYKSIFRMAVIILQMIRHNRIKGYTAAIDCEEPAVVEDAVKVINYYAEIFCSLIKIPKVKLAAGRGTTHVSLNSKDRKEIFVVNNPGKHTPAREIWYGHKIRYRLTSGDRKCAERLLREVSPFENFREGQFETLCNMLGAEQHCVCIMPTGSGKSLIYYLASLLQPLPIFIVAPTDILIQDQIRNLQTFHHIDNAAHLMMTPDNSFENFEIAASMNYLTPTTLQCRNLIVKFRYINNGTKLIDRQEEQIAVGPCAAYVVLDEIHCLSNWGHDFRPEYLMLSKYLNQYLDRITFWGFTATANYTVVEDIQKQLNIPEKNFFSPLAFEKYNVSYHFYEADSTEEMYEYLREITATAIERDERTIVFTKRDEISLRAAEAIGYEADVFRHNNPEAYHHFVDGKRKILVASEELGVGINFPNIRNIVHFGLPLSKNEYVQEVGRAGRANERVKSFVIFLKNQPENIPPALLKRDTAIEEIPELLKNLDNDYADVYRSITNDCPTKEELYGRLVSLCRELDYQKRAAYIRTYNYESSAKARQQLFMLYTVGYINDWYSYRYNREMKAVDIQIDICSENAEQFRFDAGKMFRRMQKRLGDYFEFLGNSEEAVAKTNRAQNPEEVIRVFVEWYYLKYLYHHQEQFLDLYEFVRDNMNGDGDQITKEIKDYFVLPFVKLKTDEAYYLSLTIEGILQKAMEGIGTETLANLERINTNRYSTNIDLMLLCGHYRMGNKFEEGRLMRVLRNVEESTKNTILAALPRLYGVGKSEAKLEMLEFVERHEEKYPGATEKFLDEAYLHCEKDLIYFAVIAQRLNHYFTRSGG